MDGWSDFYFNPAKMLTWKGRAYLANQLNDLRACVSQQLSPRLWYELRTDESEGARGDASNDDRRANQGRMADIDRFFCNL